MADFEFTKTQRFYFDESDVKKFLNENNLKTLDDCKTFFEEDHEKDLINKMLVSNLKYICSMCSISFNDDDFEEEFKLTNNFKNSDDYKDLIFSIIKD